MGDVRSNGTGLFERDSECAAIADSVNRAVQGDAAVLVVEGPAGIGKTRLLEHARGEARGAGLRVLSGRGSDLEREFAFGVVRQLFEPLLASTDAVGRDALLSGAAGQVRKLFERFDSSARPVGDFAALHGLFWLTANACADAPSALLIDDLQWCDAASLHYLAYLLPRIEGLGVLVVAGLRTGETGAEEGVLQQITTDPTVSVLRPRAMSAQSTGLLLEQSLPTMVDPVFAAACHRVTGGNPLLLRELVRTITSEGVTASADNAGRVVGLNPQAVARLVSVRMARISAAGVALARAVSVLGDQAELRTLAALADQDMDAVLRGVSELERLQILQAYVRGAAHYVDFVHPLVRAAVYESMDVFDRASAHRRAWKLLAGEGTDPGLASTHLLHVPPAGEPEVTAGLRAAAAEAVRRGSPASAYTYLRRALAEPPTNDLRLPVLLEAGQAALQGDLQAAARHLQQAYDQVTDPTQRADIAWPLGMAYLYLLDAERARSVWSEAVSQAPGEECRRRLEAALLNTALMVPGMEEVLQRLPRLRQLPVHESIGGRMLECAIASTDLAAGDPAAIPRARRALADGSLVEQAIGDSALACGWLPLLAADDDAAMESLQAAVAQSHRVGSARAIAHSYGFRALGWLWRGQLGEAESDARASLQAARMAQVEINRMFGDVYLADILMEQGRLDEAEQVLRSISDATTRPPGPPYFALDSRARLLRLRGDHQSALDAALLAGRTWAAYGFTNPALGSWRSEAALSLYALDRVTEAQEIAAEELALARRWGAPRALGRSLRISGLIRGGTEALTLLRDAVTVVENSPARLEHAKVLVDLGAALRRAGHRSDARKPLRQALELATACGAALLATHARIELQAVGARPQRTELTGLRALTPSERRVAAMAADRATNREIAHALFVTPKTVEVHLSSVYRKLGISSRTDLPRALDGLTTLLASSGEEVS